MHRSYEHCPSCGTRMKMLSESKDTFGEPPAAVCRYYRCPRCGDVWTHDRERNLLTPVIPEEVVNQLKLEGKVNRQGEFVDQ